MKCPFCKKDIFPGQFKCDHCGKIVPEKKVEEKKVKETKKNGK